MPEHNQLRDMISRYAYMGRPLIYKGFRYFIAKDGSICGSRCSYIECDTAEILDGTEQLVTSDEFPQGVPVGTQMRMYANKLILPPTMRKVTDGALCFTHIEHIDFGGTAEIGQAAFHDAELIHIALPDTVQKIGLNAFHSSKLSSVTLGTGMRMIDSYAFYLSSLEYIDMSRCTRLKKIHNNAFGYCTELDTVMLPHSLTELGMKTFAHSDIYMLDMSETQISRIPESCFESAVSLQYVRLPRSCTAVSKNAFKNCVTLDHIYMNKNTELHPTVKAWLDSDKVWANMQNRGVTVTYY